MDAPAVWAMHAEVQVVAKLPKNPIVWSDGVCSVGPVLSLNVGPDEADHPAGCDQRT